MLAFQYKDNIKDSSFVEFQQIKKTLLKKVSEMPTISKDELSTNIKTARNGSIKVTGRVNQSEMIGKIKIGSELVINSPSNILKSKLCFILI